MESPVCSGFAGNLLLICYLWDNGKGSQVYWTQTHLWEMNLKHCLSPMTLKMSFVLCELRAFPSPSSWFFFPKWVDLKRKLSSLLDERALKYPEALNKTGLQFLGISLCNSEPKSEGSSLSREGSQGQEISLVPSVSGKRFWSSFFVRKPGKPSYGST